MRIIPEVVAYFLFGKFGDFWAEETHPLKRARLGRERGGGDYFECLRGSVRVMISLMPVWLKPL